MAAPVSVLADGNVKVVWVPTIADTANPTVAEVTAGAAVDLSCYLTADGFTSGADEAVITDDRLCSTQTYEKPGRYTDTLTLRYVYRAQDAAGTDNKAFHTLAHLGTGYIVVRWGQDFEDALVATDVVDVYPVQHGIQVKDAPEANGVLTITQRMFITNAVQRNVPVDA